MPPATRTYLEPAHRSFEDAETLRANGRLATPDHLYGIAAECAFKAILKGLHIISQNPPQPPFKVHVRALWDEYIAVMAGRRATAYLPSGPNPFTGWSIDDRYADDADFTETRVDGHRDGAAVAMAVLEAAELDGVTS